MSSIHMKGLRTRPTYNELIEEIEKKDEKINYQIDERPK